MNIMHKVLVGLVAILLVIMIGIFAVKAVVGDSSWHAVYLRTGELYFGHLTRLPYFGLRNVYMLQANPSNTEAPLSIQKFSKVFWGPEDEIRLNRSEVVWMTELDRNGQLAQILRDNPELEVPQTGQPTQPFSQIPQDSSVPSEDTER